MGAQALNAIAFQAGWLACVVGGNRWALAAGAAVLALHYLLLARRGRDWALIAIAAGAGLAMDLGWQRIGLIRFEGATLLGMPPWLLMLWLMFATTLAHSLSWLQRRLWLAALLGAVSGPLSYYAGLKLGAATSPFAGWQVALAMAPAWMLLLPALTLLCRPAAGKKLPEALR